MRWNRPYNRAMGHRPGLRRLPAQSRLFDPMARDRPVDNAEQQHQDLRIRGEQEPQRER